MKKLTILFLLVTIILNTFTLNIVYAEENLTEKQQSLLELLGVYDENFSFDEKLTKGEFSYMLSKVAFRYGLGDGMVIPLPDNDKITDVDGSTAYVDIINTLYEFGYLTLDGFGRFHPDKYITAGEAVEMIVRTMGYTDVYLKQYGGVDFLASGKKIYNNIKSRKKTEINVYEAYNFIYNMLNADISELCMNEERDTTYLASRVCIHEVKGIVTDDGINSFEGRSDIKMNYLKIGNTLFENKSGRSDLFGCLIGGFFAEDDGVNVLLGVYHKKMEITAFSSELINKFENRTYYYYDDEFSNKIREAYIPNGVVIIYNGKPVEITDTFSKELFTPENGYVKLYDNDNDNVADILFIEDYSVGVVSSVDLQNEKIYLDGSKIIDVSDKNLFISDGKNEISVGDIIKDNVLSYFEAVDRESVKIIVSDMVFTDIVATYSSSDNSVTMKSGAKYNVLESAVKHCGNIEIGTTYDFYIDAFGNVAAYKKNLDSNNMKYGCLVKMGAKSMDLYQIRIFTGADKFEIFDVAKRVKVIWEDDSKGTYNPETLYKNLTYTGIVRYRLNAAGELNFLELPHATGGKPTTEDRLYCLVDTIITEENPNATEGYYVTVNNSVANYGGEALIDRATSVFRLPKGDASNSSMYEFLDSTAFSQGSALEIRAYGVDYKSKIATATAIYVEDGSNAADVKITNEWPSVVADIVHTYNEDAGEVYELSLSDVLGNITTAFMEKEVYDGVYSIGAGNTEPVKIQPGDVIYTRKVGDYITKALLAYDMDWVVKDERGNNVTGAIAGTELSYYSASNTLCSPFATDVYEAGQTGSVDSWKYTSEDVRIFSGWVYSYENGYIQITNQNPAYGYSYDKDKDSGSVTQIFNYGRRVNVELSKRNGEVLSVKPATNADIRSYLDYGADCTRVVITVRAYDLRSMTFYN